MIIKTNRITFLNGVGLVAFVGLLIAALVAYRDITADRLNMQGHRFLPPIVFSNPSVQIPANWRTKTEPFPHFGFDLIYKYPVDWFVEKSTWSGRNNYVVIYNKDKSQCIGFSISQDAYNLDDEIRSEIAGSGNPIPQSSVVASKSTLINGKMALIEQINYDGDQYFPQAKNKFFAASIDLGITKVRPDRVYAILTSCSLMEKDIFLQILSSISIE